MQEQACVSSPTWTGTLHLVFTRIQPVLLFAVVQSLSHIQLFATPWTAACQVFQSFTIFWSLLKLMSIESVMPSNHLILCHPLVLLPSVFPNIRFFYNESVLPIRWPSASASASVLPMKTQGWFSLGFTGLTSLQFKWLSKVFSNTTLWKHQLFGTQPSLWYNSHNHTWLLEKP